MSVIHSVEELIQRSEECKSLLGARRASLEGNGYQHLSHTKDICICGGTGCLAGGAEEVRRSFEEEIAKSELENDVRVVLTGCRGFCARGPLVAIHPSDLLYTNVRPEYAPQIVQETIMKGNIIENLTYFDVDTQQHKPYYHHIPFYEKQNRVLLRRCGLINPELIEEYIADDGYRALAKALTEMTPEEVIQVIKDSKLRGRGGAGFTTGIKWEFARRSPVQPKYVICNADEGDPGAFMDRSILEGDPHSVIEGMIIAAYAIGAKEGYIYCRAEYPVAIRRIKIALRQSYEMGLLGNNILGTGFNFDLYLKEGAGAFVCGEETALMASIEGRRGEPRPRPPFPAVSGLWSKPSNVNNVKSYGLVPQIILNGAEWFTSIGTENSPGTAIFALTGKINNTGLIEVPMGITVREIIYDIGGGIPGGKQFKAVQTGGPLGGCLPAEALDTPVDFDSLVQAGATMGSGGMIVVDEDTCMVEFAKYFLTFASAESCGKCVPCRIGGRRLLEVLTRISKGEGKPEDLDEIEYISRNMKEASLCALGQLTPGPIMSALRFFRAEYEAHIYDKKCPAKVCKGLITYKVIEENCTGCMVCKRNCPAGAISGEKRQIHYIDPNICERCGICIEVCKFDAIMIE
ncbi:MAG: NAD-reducing hydrogenase subunit HoxF [Anaerolineae bacterium]|jgi:NADP-reducing hydrogenase subunit HndC|nr:MAG: NAD-reducing hydrogenase subunit HoxF [Anaerolineae bacterium]